MPKMRERTGILNLRGKDNSCGHKRLGHRNTRPKVLNSLAKLNTNDIPTMMKEKNREPIHTRGAILMKIKITPFI